MNSSRPLVTNNNIDNEYQYFRKWKVNAEDADQIPIELTDLCEILSEIFDPFENIERDENENQENVENHEFTFSCTINIATLEGSSKEKANQIINILSDVDEYMWM
ncbi:unnamed protein product [Rhizophagus irregularis]|nr:unnamed protein product [Rhizophagus irregularis]CAB5395035.1 unnamed protein product [Rhizophagus irregularis]